MLLNETAAAGAGGSLLSILMLVVFFAIIYFLMMRPQKKEQKKKEQMLSEIAIGDTVLTTSGFYGTIIDLQDDTVIVEFGNNKNCRIPMTKRAIAEVEKPEDSVKVVETPAEEKKEKKSRFKKDKDAE